MLAFLFPGQGSQSVGMLAELAVEHPQVVDTFTAASEVLGYDLWELVQHGPEERLNQTERTQPAMLAAGVSVWRVWRARGGALPDTMAGHSLGEYSALVCADALAFETAVSLVAARGRFMQEAVPTGTGAIAAILGLPSARIIELCAQAAGDEVVSAVNFNAPEQTVIAGHVGAVERAMELASDAGAKRTVRIRMSVPSHCALMKPAADRLAETLATAEFSPPSIPVIHNVDVAIHEMPDALRAALGAQANNPVRWVDTIRLMKNQGVDKVIECGPGRVLVGLNKRIERSMSGAAVFDPASLDKALALAGGNA